MDLYLSWTNFKAIVAEKKLFVQYVIEAAASGVLHHDRYIIWARDGISKYMTEILIDASSTCCSIEGLNTEQEEANQSDFETNYLPSANRPETVAESATVSNFIAKTIEMDAEDTSAYCEWEYDSKVYLNKMLPIPIDAQWGDYVDLSIHLKANDYEVSRYAQYIYLYGERPHKWFMGNGAGEIPSYCKVRATYHKSAGSARKFIIIAEFLV